MHLEGWNHIPSGYGARFDVASAPLWLRALHGTPFLDRFAFPLLVARGHGYLSASPAVPTDELGPVGPGWRIDEGDSPPGSTAWLT